MGERRCRTSISSGSPGASWPWRAPMGRARARACGCSLDSRSPAPAFYPSGAFRCRTSTSRPGVGGRPLLPQRAYMPPQASIGAGIRFLAPETTDEATLHALERVGLLASLRRSGKDPLAIAIETLSVGERQRLAIARLLCRDAAVYLLDEPDANLDRAGIALCARLVRELSRQAMVAFAAHTPELIEVADDVVTLDRGRIVSIGTAADWRSVGCSVRASTRARITPRPRRRRGLGRQAGPNPRRVSTRMGADIGARRASVR